MGLEQRPYIGTWRLGQQRVIQQTPDALVYINGDLSVPGCQKCHSAINIQRFVTSVSVDAGTDAAAATASVSLSVPVHHLDSFARDAQFLLRPGLEVHIYMRGYFPVKGLYSNLADPINIDPITGEYKKKFTLGGETLLITDPEATHGRHLQMVFGSGAVKSTKTREYWGQLDGIWDAERDELRKDFPRDRIYGIALTAAEQTGTPPEYILTMLYTESRFTPVGRNQKPGSSAFGMTQILEGRFNEDKKNHPEIWWEHSDLVDPRFATWETAYSYRNLPKGASDLEAAQFWTGKNIGASNDPDGPNGPAIRRAKLIKENREKLGYYRSKAQVGPLDAYPPGQEPKMKTVSDEEAEGDPNALDFTESTWAPNYLQSAGLSGVELENMLAYPYYHTFHGVVSQASFSWSAGSQDISLQCASMLHFWQYHQMSTNASVFGQRPQNSKARVSMVGHNFTGMHPYEIIYTLHHDTAGSAGGIAFALSQKTNQTARAPITGESLFSLNLRYWQQRFNQKEIKLRLHGASGHLFNSAQAAFLSRLKGHQLTRLLKGRFNTASTGRAGDIFSAAVSLGLLAPKDKKHKEQYIEELVLNRSNASNPNAKLPSMELNLAEMIAFVNNISQWGQIQLFESTYESKMDIAQKVCEVTGFEFYQDVDGDFVFKPPMYNMDTSSSRVYRLEDIDIISINFDEKEPEATYMTVKGTPFKNILGHGVENEWGIQGQYIDYRLVAQFGWRPADYEASYFNDPRSMFFAAINRLDIMNAPMNSASVTIPLRPELRPGYPVYISYLDCFFYCNSFSHAYQAGGQCTTSLQLIGKRAKFYAPGDPSKMETIPTQTDVSGGIEAIRLDYPVFPPTPLEIQDGMGTPRLSGFPNVVMALDPTQINPLFFLVGADINTMESYETLYGLLKMAVDLNILVTDDKGDPGPKFTMWADDGNAITFWYPKEGSGQSIPQNALDIYALATVYASKQNQFASDQGKLREELDRKNQALAKAESNLGGLRKAQQDNPQRNYTAKIQAAREKVNEARAASDQVIVQFEQAKIEFDQRMGDAEKEGSVAYFVELIRRTGERFFKAGEFGAAYGDPSASATLLDMLGDKKAAMTNASLPGTYRYYSASHPDKEQQGQPVRKLRKTDKLNSDEVLTPFLEDPSPVKTYRRTSEIQVSDGGTIPQAQFEDRKPIWGLKVLNNREPGGQFVPTNEIRTMMFSMVDVTLSKPKTKRLARSRSMSFGGSLTSQVMAQLETLARKADLTKTPTDVFTDWLADYNITIKGALDAANEQNGELQKAADPTLVAVPNNFRVFGTTWSREESLEGYQLADNPDATDEMFPGSSAKNSSVIWKEAARWFAVYIKKETSRVRGIWWDATQSLNIPYDAKTARLNAFVGHLSGAYGSGPTTSDRVRTTIRIPDSQVVPVPVFPVSDSNGYSVFGSYQYGRDVDADVEGVLDVLARQDPLSLVSRRLVEQVIDTVVLGKPLTVENEVGGVVSATGIPATKKDILHGEAAVREVEKRLLRALREQLTDKQILDLGLARVTEDPDILQMNLANWFADKAKDGIHKIPLNNAGYSLSELTAGLITTTCSCKAAEADVLLNTAGFDDFVQVSTPGNQSSSPEPLALGERGVDPVTRSLMEQSMSRSLDWGLSQDALRGAQPDQKPSSLVQVADNLNETYERLNKQTSVQGDLLKQQSRELLETDK